MILLFQIQTLKYNDKTEFRNMFESKNNMSEHIISIHITRGNNTAFSAV